MRRRLFACVVVLLLCVPMVAVARGGADNETPGRQNDEPGVAMGDLYGDLYTIVRDANGEPIPYTWVWSDDGTTPLYPVLTPAGETGFWQPVAISDEEAVALGLEPLPEEFGGLVPLDIEGLVPEAYAEYTQEVDFGRLNLARAPSEFLDLAYEEAINAINSAGSVSLDPAGRLLLTTGDESKAIDSPRENLALYRELMRNGYLPGLVRGDLTELAHLRQGAPSEWEKADLDRAASFLSAAADKGGYVSVDKVVYLNSFLGINELPEYFDFVTFGGEGYTYQRGGDGGAYSDVTAVLLQGPVAGVTPDTFIRVDDVSVLDKVFGNSGYGPGSPGAAEFAQAADDALKVITYIHNWAIPEYETE